MSEYGIKSSKPSKPVTSTDSKDLAFSSQFPLLKVHMKGSKPISSPTTIQIDHGLGYIPAFILTAYGPSGFTSGQRNLLDLYTSGTDQIKTYADKSTVYATCSGTWTGQLYYYIFLDPIK